MATRLQARAVDAAPHRSAPKVTGRSQWPDFHKDAAELLTPYPAKFGIPFALEATTTSKGGAGPPPSTSRHFAIFDQTSIQGAILWVCYLQIHTVKEKWPFGAGQGCSGRATLGFHQT